MKPLLFSEDTSGERERKGAGIIDSEEQQAGTAQHTEVRVLHTSPQTNITHGT